MGTTMYINSIKGFDPPKSTINKLGKISGSKAAGNIATGITVFVGGV